MPSSSLKLRSIMNNPASLDLTRTWMPLNERPDPTLLVYDGALAKQILKAPTVQTYNLVAYWKIVSGMNGEPLTAVETLFTHTPMFQHGHAHTDTRKRLLKIYDEVESQLDLWLPDFCATFFSRAEVERQNNPEEFVGQFLEALVRAIFAHHLGCSPASLPDIPKSIFRMLVRADNLREYDRRLADLATTAERILQKSGRDPKVVWILMSISVMGREPLFGALLFSIFTQPSASLRWDAKTLMYHSASVSILGREVIADCNVQDLSLKKGQLVHICPFLIHLRDTSLRRPVTVAAGASPNSFSFGFGSHLCPGRKISLKIAQHFLDQMALRSGLVFDTSGLRMTRDFTLAPAL
jgi:cytochrome P450